MPSKTDSELGARVKTYLDNRRWALEENLKDVQSAIENRYLLEVVHFLGGESTSVLSARMEQRRSFARRSFWKSDTPRPALTPITSTRLTVS